jgi:hypothetical protein
MNLFDPEPSSLSLAKTSLRTRGKRPKAAWNEDLRAKVMFG